jgi:hypothetical protein
MSSNNTSAATTAEKNDFVISELIQEHETFEHISDSKFLTSTKLCELISGMFGSIYADFEGCNMEFIPGTNQPSITLYFNHKDNSGSTLPAACTKEDVEAKASNSTLRSTRSYNNRLINGDRYYLTKEGRALEEFVFDGNQFYKTNKDGVRSANWDKLVSEIADGNFQYQNVYQQFTQVKCLDPSKIVEAIFGTIDESGNAWVYGVRVLRSIPSVSIINGVTTAGFVVAIERVSKNEVEALAKQFGLNTNNGLNIIR